MPRVSIKICTTLHTILQHESFDNFQIVHLRDAFIAASANDQNVIESYKFIYRQVVRLVKKGLLKKINKENEKTVIYQKTEQFYQVIFVTNERNGGTKPSSKFQDITDHDAIHLLKERLKESEIDLLTSIGESEEYMQLYKSFPEMKEHLEFMYMLARENSSKLLGQIKAIKSVLAHQQK